MDATQILADRIQHEIDMDILREISEQVRVDLTKEIELAEKKFNNKIDRVINGLTNKVIHSDNSK
jgi:hypothetical protein